MLCLVPISENDTKRVASWPWSAVNMGRRVGLPPRSGRLEVGFFFFSMLKNLGLVDNGQLSEISVEQDKNAGRWG